MKIKLGNKVRDKVTGFEGIATARIEYINKCVQFCVKPKVKEDGKMPDGEYIDVDELEIVIRQRIKPSEVEIKGVLNISSFAPNGIEIVKEALTKTKHDQIDVRYKSAGHYHISVKASNYPEAEEILKKTVDEVISFTEKNNGEASFLRDK